MLSDPDSKIIRAYGLLNETVPKGPFYGIPYPGTFILSTQRVVVEKFFEDDYTQRYTASDILVKQFGATAGAAHSTIDAKHVKLSLSAGSEVVHSGQRIALALDLDMKPGVHVYAPGVQGYIPVDLNVLGSDALTAHPAVYPASKMMRLEAINETAPVYTDQVRIVREVTIGKSAKPGELVVEGSFKYQACDEKQCFIPETVPLKWVLRVEVHDRQRAPAEIQHK